MGRVMGSHMLHTKAKEEPERFAALEKAGFRLDRTGDMTYYLLEKLGGHYMDVGTSAKIAKGLVSDFARTTGCSLGCLAHQR